MSLTLALGIVIPAFVISAVAIAVLKRLAAKRGWLDRAGADPLKIHSTPIPFVGGLGIALGSLVPLAVAFARDPQYILILGLSLCCVALGFQDDRRGLSPWLRLCAEIFIGIALAVGGLFHPGMAAGLILLYVIGAMNAVNMLDGLDGMAGGVALIGCAGFGVVGVQLGQRLTVALALALGGSLAAFLVYNYHPASVFMGDNGSYFVGFMIATMALLLLFARRSWWSIPGTVLLVGMPVFDAGFAIVRRLRRGVSPFSGDRSHFYDYLAGRGLSTRAVAVVSYALQTCSVSLGAAWVLR